MSYSIIFQSKIVKLNDGRVIYFSRRGCNNDDSGRTPHEYHAELYSLDDFIHMAEGYMRDSKPYKDGGDFELKIGSRTCSMYDYGSHLLRMFKRAENQSDFMEHNTFNAYIYKGFEVIQPFKKVYLEKEYPHAFLDMMYRDGDFKGAEDVRYRRIISTCHDIDESISLLEEYGYDSVEFYIKKHKNI